MQGTGSTRDDRAPIGEMPPFQRDRDASFAMTRVVLELQAEGYRIPKGIDPGATVATIEVYLDVRPRDPADPGHRLFAERFDAWYHGALLEGLATGWVRLPDREPFELPALRGALDAYGPRRRRAQAAALRASAPRQPARSGARGSVAKRSSTRCSQRGHSVKSSAAVRSNTSSLRSSPQPQTGQAWRLGRAYGTGLMVGILL